MGRRRTPPEVGEGQGQVWQDTGDLKCAWNYLHD